MDAAFAEAEKAEKRGEVPVGAVIVDGKTRKVLAADGNRVLEQKNPTAHAEMLVIRQACETLGSERLGGCDLYVTLEPCPMCAQAVSFARIRRLYFGAEDKKMGGVQNGPRIFKGTSCYHAPEVYGGISVKQVKKLMQDFFKNRR